MSQVNAMNPVPQPPQPTCLFTGAPLGPDTHVEHTIPRALGGRIYSRIVSSDAFNNDCGSRVDPYLIRLYAETIAHLGPLMSAQHQPGNLAVEIPGSPGRFVLDAEGSLTIQGLAVIARNPATGRPTAVAGADAAAVRRWVQQNAPPGSNPRESFVPATTEPNFFLNRLVIGPVIEIAALKAVMLSFDHQLAQGDPARRFTRHAALEPVRRFVRDAVATMRYDGEDLHRFSLGVQYERLELFGRLRDRVAGPRQPFEHVLFASGNTAARTLDCVLWVAGIDPFGFRLCDRWQGGDFLCTLVNGMLVNGAVTGPEWVEAPESLCQPTNRRSFPSTPTEAAMQTVMAEMAVFRGDGHRRAVDLVERSDPDLLRRRLTTTAELGVGGDHTLAAACRERLRRLYQRRIEAPGNRGEFGAEVDAAFAVAGGPAMLGAAMPPPSGGQGIDWDRVLAAYHDALGRLRQRFGLPGEPFVNASIVDVNRSGEGRLDDHPLSL